MEKAFLLHELFSVNSFVEARRRSRHIYDLHMMMRQGIADKAVPNDELWQTIHHHRSTLTSMSGVDYSIDIRKNIQLIPPKESMADWKKDYEEMASAMIYGEKPAFAELLENMRRLELLFRKTITKKTTNPRPLKGSEENMPQVEFVFERAEEDDMPS